VSEVLPLLYLHGLSTSDFGPALEQFLGSGHGLSAPTITRLTEQWKDDAEAFNARTLADVDYVYMWVDGIHLKVRLEQDKVCLLVMIGVRADGTKELIALADGFRESSESWADLLRDCKRRGMRAPVLAVGDGALGFWKALREVFPETREQRCWFHVQANVLAALPKSAHPGGEEGARRDLQRRGPRACPQGGQDVRDRCRQDGGVCRRRLVGDESVPARRRDRAMQVVALVVTGPLRALNPSDLLADALECVRTLPFGQLKARLLQKQFLEFPDLSCCQRSGRRPLTGSSLGGGCGCELGATEKTGHLLAKVLKASFIERELCLLNRC
jgi:hypothetical protein